MNTDVFDPKLEMVIQALVRIDPNAWIEEKEKETINVKLPVPKNVKKFLELVLGDGEELLGRSSEDFKSALFFLLVIRGITCSVMGAEAVEEFIKDMIPGISKLSGNLQSAFSTLDKINMDELKDKERIKHNGLPK